jgi:hypothetical protein
MRAESFERLKVRLARDLTAEQCMALITLLQKQAHERLGEVVLQRRTEVIAETPRCVYCGNTDIVRHGRGQRREPPPAVPLPPDRRRRMRSDV